MLSREENELLTLVHAGTPLGRFEAILDPCSAIRGNSRLKRDFVGADYRKLRNIRNN